jgi:hypothetical protein
MTRHMGLGLHVLSKCFFNNQEMCVLARWTVQTYPVVIFFLTQHKLYAIMIAFATFAVAKMVFCA